MNNRKTYESAIIMRTMNNMIAHLDPSYAIPVISTLLDTYCEEHELDPVNTWKAAFASAMAFHEISGGG